MSVSVNDILAFDSDPEFEPLLPRLEFDSISRIKRDMKKRMEAQGLKSSFYNKSSTRPSKQTSLDQSFDDGASDVSEEIEDQSGRGLFKTSREAEIIPATPTRSTSSRPYNIKNSLHSLHGVARSQSSQSLEPERSNTRAAKDASSTSGLHT
jgi:hypothetical protein